MRNDYIVVGFIGLLIGLFIGGLIGIKNVREAADINAVLVHQVDAQTRLTA